MTNENSETADSTADVNMSRLRQMAVKGHQYRETIDFTYYGEEGELILRPLTDEEFLPIAAFLEERLNISTDEAQEMLDEGKEEVDGSETIDASQFDKDFVEIMHKAAIFGIDTTDGIAEGEDDEGVKEIVKMLQGGKSLVIAEKVLEMSSDADTAKSFRRDGGGE